MANIQTTTNVAMATTMPLAIAEWATNPTWPPPASVITIAFGLLAPLAHLVGRGIYRRIAKWAGEPEDAPVLPTSGQLASVPGKTV